MSVNFQFAHFQEQRRYWELWHQDQTQWDEQGQTQPWDTCGVPWGTPVQCRPVQGASSLRGTGSVGPGRAGQGRAALQLRQDCAQLKAEFKGWGGTSAVVILQLCLGLSYHRHRLDKEQSRAKKTSLWGRLGLTYSEKDSPDKLCRYNHLCSSVLFNISCYFLFHMVSLTGKFILKKTSLKTQSSS